MKTLVDRCRTSRWCWAVLLSLVLGTGLLAWFMIPGRPKVRLRKIAAGAYHLVVVKSDGSLWAMGDQMRYSTMYATLKDSLRLMRISEDTDWAEVAAGDSFSLALKKDGSLWSWGANEHGQLGSGTQVSRDRPARVGQDRDWISVSAGPLHSVALKTDGTLWSWGLSGRVRSCQLTPARVGVDTNWQALAAGGIVCAIKRDGTLWRCLVNAGIRDARPGISDPTRFDRIEWPTSSSAGTGVTTNEVIPVRIGGGTNWTTLVGGSGHWLGLQADGTLWTWGRNEHGQLGIGTATPTEPEPRRVGVSTDWRAVGVGMTHSLALKADGSLWVWGDNRYGQVGNGSTTNALLPVRVGRANDWLWAAGGGAYSVGLKTDGSLWMWGMWGHTVAPENASMAWLRQTIAKYNIPVRLPPPRALDLVPVRIVPYAFRMNFPRSETKAPVPVGVP
jgi:alpha-tubulin suppressor-like RCC1 family protein